MELRLRSLYFFLLLLLTTAQVSFGEGSKQLTPGQSGSALTNPANDKAGYLVHDANFPSVDGTGNHSLSFLKPAGYSRNGVTYSKDHRLKIRVRNGGILYFGVRRAIHNRTGNHQNNLKITVRRTNVATGVDDPDFVFTATLLRDPSSTRSMLLMPNQDGVINTYAEAQAGPNRLAIGGQPAVANGYKPLAIYNYNSPDYDYYFEFEQENEEFLDDNTRYSEYDIWDFTVIDSQFGEEKIGRLHSKLWPFSAGGAGNVFSSAFNMHPLVPSAEQANKFFVKKVELAGIAPRNVFRFVTNSYGTDVGTTAEERRRSQTSRSDNPEYDIFVNRPDARIWETPVLPALNVTVSSNCNANEGVGRTTFTFNSSHKSTFIALVNLNGQQGYQPNTTDVLIEQSGPAGTHTIEWNGLDGKGNPVACNASYDYFFQNANTPIHFPIWDVAVNDGFRVEEVQPLGSGTVYNSRIFWDDSNLPTAAFPGTKVQLYGVVAGSTNGVHSWGSTTTTAANYNAGEGKTINTWVYGALSSNYRAVTDLAVTNIASAGPYTIGTPVTFTVTITNNGRYIANNVSVTDKLNTSQFSDISSSDPAYVVSSGIWTVGTSLAVGASRTLTITAKPLVLGTISITATQTRTEADNVAANNSATASINVVASADIEVKNVVPQNAYNVGDTFVYSVTTKNLGPNSATGVVITSKLPQGLKLQNLPAAYDSTSGVWSVGALALNETKILTLQAKAVATGNYTSNATLGNRASNELDTNSDNNASSYSITVQEPEPLPVTFISFTGASQLDNILLKWSTALEINNSHFVIERSQNGKEFHAVGKVVGHGSTNLQSHYVFSDKQLQLGDIYYRLKQVDHDSTFAYSRMILVQQSNHKQRAALVKVYPNPASDIIHLDLTALPPQEYIITLRTITGKIITQTLENGGKLVQLNTNNLAHGKYIIQVKGLEYAQVLNFIKL